MIKKLDNNRPKTAKQIHSVFQVSYAVEAQILQADDFPPLKRPVESFLTSKTDFYGFYKAQELAAVIEIDYSGNNTHLQSLVVQPKFFRQGIGQQLINFVFNEYTSKTFSVETGLANEPAVNLYKKLGFIETKQWDTDHGIRKIRFEKKLI